MLNGYFAFRKIKRIIFESLQKFNGRTEIPLSLTQIKQIAGRAGRFGMHKTAQPTPVEEAELDEDEELDHDVIEPVTPDEVAQPGGTVTTLHKADLPILRSLLPLPLPPLKRATLDIPYTTMSDLSVLLPSGIPFAHLLDHLNALALLPPNTVPGAFDQKIPLADVLEPFRDRLSLAEMDLFTYSPVSTRDLNAINIFTNIVRDYADSGRVDVDKVFETSRLLVNLDMTEATLATLPPLPPVFGIGRRLLTPPIIISSIPLLETLHKSLVLYIWLSFRMEVSFPDRSLAISYKNRAEAVLDECLARLPGLRNKKTYERDRVMDRKVADWRKAYVNPNGTSRAIGQTGKKGIDWMPMYVAQRLKEKNMWRAASVTIDQAGAGESAVSGSRGEQQAVE